MKENFVNRLLVPLMSLSLLVLLCVPGVANTERPAQAARTEVNKKTADESERAREAASVLDEIMGAPDKAIPAGLLQSAHAIAIVPHVVKAAFGIGGRFGKGLIAQRKEDGSWSAPAYIDVGGASIGFQIGAEATDYVLVFTNEDGLKPLLDGKVELGADASVAAGPVGRNASASTDITLNSAIYSYSRSKGLFAGVALQGAVLSMDDSSNQEVYDQKLTGKNILLEGKVRVNAVGMPFIQALQKHMPPHRHSSQ